MLGLNERKCLLFLFALFIILSISIELIPYNPAIDLADATTNDIWADYYARGVYSIPYSDWHFGQTQSVVVNHSGQYLVVNEKGPGHVMMMVPFHALGVGFLFEPMMIAFAVFSTYMLGKRLINWRVGFLASILVLTNVTVLVMWYRYYWTDASTMHMLILSFWLVIESNYWLNGKSLDPHNKNRASSRQLLIAVGLGVLAGLSFGLSVSTRYATALIIIALLSYILAFYLIRFWPSLKERRTLTGLKEARGILILVGTFMLGLTIVLVPLIQYNSEYFGAPFKSGYDATLIFQFQNNNESLTNRDTSGGWSADSGSMLSIAFSNFFALLPVLVSRMPGLILFPLAILFIRKKPALWFLPIWIVINFFTYLSISWVDMYAGMPSENLHEPRYWLPAVPPIAILAGLALDRLIPWAIEKINSKRDSNPRKIKLGRTVLTIAIVAIISLYGIIPAISYFADMEPGGALSPGGKQPPKLPPPRQQQSIAQSQATSLALSAAFLVENRPWTA